MKLYRLERKQDRKQDRLSSTCNAFVLTATDQSSARGYAQAYAMDHDLKNDETASDWRDSRKTKCDHIGATYIPKFSLPGTILLVDFHYA